MVRVYVKAKQCVQIKSECVRMKDVAEIRCLEPAMEKKIKNLPIYYFSAEETRSVISALQLVQTIEAVYGGIPIQLIGETDILMERKKSTEDKNFFLIGKILFVCLISFFGTAFTIMAYHNDIGIVMLFREVYRIFMNAYPKGPNVLEVCYSIGLAVGILIFYNHIGPRRLTNDPTPMEVSMFEYEQSADSAIISLAEKQEENREENGLHE